MLRTEMESSAFVPPLRCAGQTTPQRRKPSFIDCADCEKEAKAIGYELIKQEA